MAQGDSLVFTLPEFYDVSGNIIDISNNNTIGFIQQ